MAPLWRPAGVGALIVTALILGAAIFAGSIRVLPWLLSPEVPLEVTAPFARVLVRGAIEVAVLVGPPAGAAYAGAVLVESGQVRALFSLGASPERLGAAALWPTVGIAILAAGLTSLVGFTPAEPGRFAARLVEEGRESCRKVEQPRSIEVPMAGITWLCFPGDTPRVVGEVPRSRGQAWFTASGIELSDDLSSVELSGLQLRLRGSSGLPDLRLGTDAAEISGLASWGSSERPPWRSALPFLIVLVTAPAVLVLVLRFGVRHRALALAVGGAPGVSALAGLGASHWALWGPLGAALALASVAAALGFFPTGFVARRRA